VSQLRHLLIVDDASLLIQPVWESLVVLGYGGDLLGGCLVPVRQMAAVGEVETEDTVVGIEDSGVGVEVCG